MYAGRLVYIPALAALGVIYGALFPVNKMSAEAGLPYGSIRALYAFVIDCLERQEVGLWTSRVSRCGFRRRAG